MKGSRGAGYYRFWLAQYLLVLVIPLTLGIMIYTASSRVIRENLLSSSNASLEQSCLIIDSKLEELSNWVKNITLNEQVRAFSSVKDPFSRGRHYRVVRLKQVLDQYRSLDPFWSSLFILFADNHAMVGNDMAYNLDSAYSPVYTLNGADIRAVYRELIDGARSGQVLPAQSIYALSASQRDKSNIVLYTFGDYFDPEGVICILLPQDRLVEVLSGALGEGDGMVCMLDGQNNVLSSAYSGEGGEGLLAGIDLGFDQPYEILRVQGRRMLACSYTSPVSGYRYVSVRDLDGILGKMNDIRNIIALLLVASIIGSLVVSLFFSIRNGRSIGRIVASLFDHGKQKDSPRGDPFDWLFLSVSSMASSNRRLLQAIDNTKPYLSVLIAERLIRNEFNDGDEVGNLCRHAGIRYAGSRFGAALVELSGCPDGAGDKAADDLRQCRQQARTLIGRWTGCDTLLCNIDEYTLAVLWAAECGEQECQQLMEDLYGLLDGQIPRLRMGVGRAYSKIMDVSRSYGQAVQALNAGKSGGGGQLFFYRDIEQDFHHYYYPTDLESKVVNCVVGGDEGALSALLDDILQENILNNRLGVHMQRMFVLELLGTCVKLSDRCGMDAAESSQSLARLSKAALEDAPARAGGVLGDALIQMSRRMRRHKSQHSHYLIDAVCRHVESHYGDSGLGLAPLSREFNISEMYLSQLFKEQTGEKFSVYLEGIRMGRARTLLVQTGMGVAEIARTVGYSSFNSFCRAFRRRHGINATDYRAAGADAVGGRP